MSAITPVYNYFYGQSLRQSLWALGGIVAARAISFAVKSPRGMALTAINVLCCGIILKNAYQWRHVLTHLVAVPLLSNFNVHLHVGGRPKMFEENECKNLGYIKYEKDAEGNAIPVMQLNTSDPYEKGYAQGTLMASQIFYLYEKVLKALMSFSQMRVGDSKGKWLEEKIKTYTFPEDYKKEMQGICDGVNETLIKKGIKFQFNLNHFLQLHAFTDTYKTVHRTIFSTTTLDYLGNLLVTDLGCSVVVLREGGETIVGRNLDWPGMGMAIYGFIRREKLPDGDTLEIHTYPGLIGALTALRFREGKIIMTGIVNECAEKTGMDGIPYSLWVRRCMEQCKSVAEVQKFVDEQPKVASSFHFTVVDNTHATTFQFYPYERKYYLCRNLCANGFLVVTNHFVDPDTFSPIGQFIPHYSNSLSRFEKLTKWLYKNQQPISLKERTIKCLQLVNRPFTLFSMVAHIGKSDRTYINANGFAADFFSSKKNS